MYKSVSVPEVVNFLDSIYLHLLNMLVGNVYLRINGDFTTWTAQKVIVRCIKLWHQKFYNYVRFSPH